MVQNLQNFEKKINQDSLEIAAKDLWSLFSPYLEYLSSEKRDFVQLGFDFMVQQHGTQRRKSGDFYIIHPVSAAIILAQMEFDKETLTATLLHDVPEDVCKNRNEGIRMIEREFGKEVGFLVSGITKLSVIKYDGDKEQVENLRRLFVAMSKDLRVIFIKLADRLHNLRTLKSLKPDKAQRIAMESLEIYAPIAERLGVGFLRMQIENAAFPYAYPSESRYYLNLPELNFSKRTKIVNRLKKKTEEILDKNQIQYSKVFGRAKHHYSVYKKINIEKKTLAEIYDLVALRIVTSTVANCYKIMSLLHSYFEVFEDRTKDYIEEPKENGYQSIHLTVRDYGTNQIFEFQIRTQRMHEYAEFGVAAHWWYKENLSGESMDFWLTKKKFGWIRSLVEIDKNSMESVEYMKNVRLNVYPDRIFVLTPKSHVIDLPTGATSIDFAYKIHEDIGSHAIMAKINGKVSKLNEKLKTGDVVEIITSKNQQPSIDWLIWAKNNSTTKKIRSFLRSIGMNFVGDEKKPN